MPLLVLLLAALVGVSLGMLGGGGSILTVPILVYAAGFDAKTAIAMSLPVVGTTSLAGALGHWRAGNVRLAAALSLGGVAMVGAFAGARLATLLGGTTQLVLLAVVMLAAAASMLRGGVREDDAAPAASGIRRGPLLLVGLGVGVLTGLVGIGGGFLMVPALVILARLPMAHAVGTSLVVIAMNAASGFLGYAGEVDVPWRFTILFTLVAVAGSVAGTAMVRHVPQRVLRRAFAVLLLVTGAALLYQNLRPAAAPDGAASVRR